MNDPTYGAGMRVTGAFNLIVHNSAGNNAQHDYSIAISNNVGPIVATGTPAAAWANFVH